MPSRLFYTGPSLAALHSAGPLLTLFYSPAKLPAGHEAYLSALQAFAERD